MPTARRLMIAQEKELDCVEKAISESKKTEPNSGWWTIPGKKCAAAFNSKGAVNYKQSKVDLTGREYNLFDIPSELCTWSNSDGWGFANGKALRSNIVPRDIPIFSMFVVFDTKSAPNIWQLILACNRGVQMRLKLPGFVYIKQPGSSLTIAQNVTKTSAHCFGGSVNTPIFDGVDVTSGIIHGSGADAEPFPDTVVPIAIGASNDAIYKCGIHPATTRSGILYIHSFAFYYAQTTIAEGIALSSRMLAL